MKGIRFAFSYPLILSALLLMLSFSSCKKDKGVTGNQVTGSWRDITTPSALSSYYLFTADKKVYHLQYGYDSYKRTDYSIYKITGNQILIQGSPTLSANIFLYNLRTSGDTLILNDGNTDAIVLIKDNLAPKVITDWSKSITVLDKFIDTVRSNTITYNSGKLYSFKGYSSGSKLVEYNPALHNVSALTPADMTYNGLDFIDGILWCVEGQYAYIFNPGAGVFIFKSSVTSTGNYLWATAAGNGHLYNYTTGAYLDYTTADDSWGNNREANTDVTDLAYANGYEYVAKGGMIHRMHPYYKQPGDTWYMEGYEVKGIAYDGTNFWLTALNNATGNYEMMKVSLN